MSDRTSRKARIEIRQRKSISYMKGDDPFHDGTTPDSCAIALEMDLDAENQPWTVPQDVLDRCRHEAAGLVVKHSCNRAADLIADKLISDGVPRIPGKTILRNIAAEEKKKLKTAKKII